MAKEFKSIEDAQKAFNSLSEKYAAEVDAHSKSKEALGEAEKALQDEKNAHEKTKAELKVVEETAQDAISKANDALRETPDRGVTVTVDKKKYRINFGVDGFSKEDLRNQKALLGKLIKIGSGALTEVN